MDRFKFFILSAFVALRCWLAPEIIQNFGYIVYLTECLLVGLVVNFVCLWDWLSILSGCGIGCQFCLLVGLVVNFVCFWDWLSIFSWPICLLKILLPKPRLKEKLNTYYISMLAILEYHLFCLIFL
jgi:hypothetical protein